MYKEDSLVRLGDYKTCIADLNSQFETLLSSMGGEIDSLSHKCEYQFGGINKLHHLDLTGILTASINIEKFKNKLQELETAALEYLSNETLFEDSKKLNIYVSIKRLNQELLNSIQTQLNASIKLLETFAVIQNTLKFLPVVYLNLDSDLLFQRTLLQKVTEDLNVTPDEAHSLILKYRINDKLRTPSLQRQFHKSRFFRWEIIAGCVQHIKRKKSTEDLNVTPDESSNPALQKQFLEFSLFRWEIIEKSVQDIKKETETLSLSQ